MRYLQYKLCGFQQLTLMNNNDYYPLNNQFFKGIHISDDVQKLTVELKDEINYKKNYYEIESYLNQICFNMIINSNINLDSPYRQIEVINDNDENDKYKEISMVDSITLKDKVTIQRNVGAHGFYQDILNNQTAMDKHFVLYDRIFKTLFNPNKVVQFLSLYQFLIELSSKGKSFLAQRYVTEFIRKHESKYPNIDFKPSRKSGKFEDSLTYLRNEIGHCEDTNDLRLYSQLGLRINDYVIKQIITVLNDVIMELP